MIEKVLDFIKRVNFIPPLLIFSFDIFIVTFVLFISFFILENLNLIDFDLSDFSRWSSLALFITALFMYTFKSYRSFLRYTEFYEIIKIASVFVFSFLVFIILESLNTNFELGVSVPVFYLLFVYLVSFVALSTYRLLVKEFYFFLNRENRTVKNIIIYGTDYSAITLYQLFKRDLNYKHQVVAFFDENLPDNSKQIYGVKIYSSLDLFEDCLNSFEVSEVIISSDSLSVEKKQFIFQACYRNQVEIKYFPSISELKNSSVNLEHLRKLKLEDLLGRSPIHIDQNHLSFNLKGRRVLVSGAGGSIGSELCRQICKYPIAKIILLDFAESALFEIQQELIRNFPTKKIEAVLCDIRSFADLEEVFIGYNPELVFHAAAYKHVPLMESFPKLAIQTNIFGTKNLVDLSIKFDVLKFLLISTDKAVNPSNVMGASKRCAELYVQSKTKLFGKSHSTEFVITRFGNVLGSNGSVIPLFTKQIENGGPVTVTHKDIVRYFMTIPEACSLVLEAFSMGKDGSVFVFDMGDPVRIVDLAEKMIKLTGKKPYIDIPIMFSGLRPGEKLFEELFNDSDEQSKTYNPKIFIINNNCDFDLNLDLEINRIKTMIENNADSNSLVKLIKEIIPEFKSQESKFVELDKTV